MHSHIVADSSKVIDKIPGSSGVKRAKAVRGVVQLQAIERRDRVRLRYR